MPRIAIFASGGGSNAEAIFQHFKNHDNIHVSLVVSNNEDAFVLERSLSQGIDIAVLSKAELSEDEKLSDLLKIYQIDYIILAGFLLLIPKYLINLFPRRIINIHPALLPKYGGKGMYGHHVHEAVHKNSERESGMTIHFVDENYDEGQIIFQAKTKILPEDKPEDIAAKVLKLEHQHYAEQIEKLITFNLENKIKV